MTVYAIAQVRFTDRAAYDRYQARFMEVFRRHPGTLLTADESPRVVEGQWDREKVVLMSFPDESAFDGWALLQLERLSTRTSRRTASRAPIRWCCW